MTYGDGIDRRDAWHSMTAPPRVGTCKKLRQGQLLMQRYQHVHKLAGMTKDYGHLAPRVKERSIVLATRMREHAKNCAICTRERVLFEETFYGVGK